MRQIATGSPTAERRRGESAVLPASWSGGLPKEEVEIPYPTYSFGDVLLAHGHYLDPHARLTGSRGDRLLTNALWSIATGGPEDRRRSRTTSR